MLTSILKIGISRNTNCDNLIGFPKSGRINKRIHKWIQVQIAYTVYNYSTYVQPWFFAVWRQVSQYSVNTVQKLVHIYIPLFLLYPTASTWEITVTAHNN